MWVHEEAKRNVEYSQSVSQSVSQSIIANYTIFQFKSESRAIQSRNKSQFDGGGGEEK